MPGAVAPFAPLCTPLIDSELRREAKLKLKSVLTKYLDLGNLVTKVLKQHWTPLCSKRKHRENVEFHLTRH